MPPQVWDSSSHLCYFHALFTPERLKLFGSHGQRPWFYDLIKFAPPRKSPVATGNEDDQPKPTSRHSDEDSDKAADQPAQGNDGKRVPLVISIKKSDDDFVAKVGDEVIGIGHPLDSFLARKCRILNERGISPKTLIVVIRADEDIPTGIIQSVIELLQGHKFEKFSLRAKNKKNAS